MLTTEQLATLKAAILADPMLAEWAATGRMLSEIAAALNEIAVPEYIVWRTDVNPDEINRNGMAWELVDNLTVGKARVWEWMTRLGMFDASRPNIRAGIDQAWVGTAAMLAMRAVVYTHCKRSATRGEKVFATGTGTTASPATMTFEGSITSTDVDLALKLA